MVFVLTLKQSISTVVTREKLKKTKKNYVKLQREQMFSFTLSVVLRKRTWLTFIMLTTCLESHTDIRLSISKCVWGKTFNI